MVVAVEKKNDEDTRHGNHIVRVHTDRPTD